MNSTLPVRSPPAPRRAVQPAPPRRRERRSVRSVWVTAFTVSALLHLILFLGVQIDARSGPADIRRGAPLLIVQPAAGTRVEQIAIVPDDPELEGDVPVTFPEPRFQFEAPTIPGLPVVRDVPPGAVTPERVPSSFRERLSPGARTPEVWLPPSPIHSPLTKEAAAAARLSGRLDAYNDSMALAAAAAARAVDWTTTDAEGRRWGVSPGQLHLGDITLPLPIQFQQSEEAAGRVRDWNEIQAQGSRVEGKETFEERVKAIRERKAKERREGPPPP